MILPTKNLDQSRAIIIVGGEILALLQSPKTNSKLWDDYKEFRLKQEYSSVSYDWFVLALDFLFLIGTILYDDGKIIRVKKR
ncbi:MAG TPA: hypothetical protein DIW44_00600 [Anaerolineaceae bacterium]|nr:hypothetical protein [Anaerolineaceae bacterium]